MLVKLIKRMIVVVVLVDVAYLGYHWPPSHLIASKALGRSACSFGDALDAYHKTKRFNEVHRRIKSAVRLIGRDDDLQLWETPQGKFWIPETSAAKFPLVLAEQELKIYGDGPGAVQPGDIVLDCGADVGTFTRQALGAGARIVVAIELAPRKEPCLKRSFEAEIAQGRVIVYPKGVWDRDDVLTLHEDSVVLSRNGKGTSVPLTTIDRIVQELRLPRVDFIKMDIEGAEKPALAGAKATLRNFRPRLAIATEHFPDDAEAIPKVIRDIVPDYKIACGWCTYKNLEVEPLVLFFR